MTPIILKFKGNESILQFSNLDQEELSKTWRVCTKVKDSLENGSRLENLSWRLWFLHNVLDKSRLKELSVEINETSQLQDLVEVPQQSIETPECVLDYSLENIKPVSTNNYIMNQFTSDQQSDQMIELNDIFPEEMQDIIYPEIYQQQQLNQQYSSYLSDQNSSLIYNMTNNNSIPYVTNVSQPLSYNNNNNNNLFIDGIHSVFIDEIETPSISIPSGDLINNNSNYNNFNNDNSNYNFNNSGNRSTSSSSNNSNNYQQNLTVDFNNAAYIAAAAAATAAALTSIPNATLHNKLLATLPKQTLASAEKLLQPSVNNKSSAYSNKTQEHYYNTFSVQDSTHNTSSKNKANNHSQSFMSDPSEEKPLICSNCEATSTPLWRRSDDKLLCNACGLYLKLHHVPRPKHLKPSNKNKDSNLMNASDEDNNSEKKSETQIVCSNCSTTKTPLWRRDLEGLPLCNACGLYLKLHNEKRPLSMKTDIIKKRQRTEALLANTSTDQLKKPKYFDHHSLYSKGKNANGNSAVSLPGTGILMMTSNNNNKN